MPELESKDDFIEQLDFNATWSIQTQSRDVRILSFIDVNYYVYN